MVDRAIQIRAAQQAELCRVFANPTRILILWLLLDHEKSVSEIAEAISASLQCTSQHLRIMRQKNVLTSRRDGQLIYYRVSTRNDGGPDCCPVFMEAARLGDASLEKST